MNSKAEIRQWGLALLSKREYSAYEFTQKALKRFPTENEIIESLLADFVQQDWVSDTRYTEDFIKHQILITKSGPQKIIQKLSLKGVSKQHIQEGIEQWYPFESQKKIATGLAEKKYSEIQRKRKEYSEFEIQQKVSQFLIGKGFSFEIVKQVVETTEKR